MRLNPNLTEGRPAETIYIGGIYVSDRPCTVQTLLGSCIAVCLRDPISQVGGMNHYLLPQCPVGSAPSYAYGEFAIEKLINECVRLGAIRSQLVAKIFGGANVLRLEGSSGEIPQRNYKFAHQFLASNHIPVVARSVGGNAAREVVFFTDTGRAFMRRIETDLDTTSTQPDSPTEVVIL